MCHPLDEESASWKRSAACPAALVRVMVIGHEMEGIWGAMRMACVSNTVRRRPRRPIGRGMYRSLGQPGGRPRRCCKSAPDAGCALTLGRTLGGHTLLASTNNVALTVARSNKGPPFRPESLPMPHNDHKQCTW